MKKIIVLIGCLVVSFNSFSQTDNNNAIKSGVEQSVFSLGFQGGFGHSYLMPHAGSRFQPSWDAGIAAIYAPGVHWGVELDVRYSVEGTKITNPETNKTSVTELRYIRVPLKAVYFCGTYENDFRPKFSIGPTIGFLNGETNSIGANAVDFGASASLGFHYRLARAIWFTTDVNYYQGFTDAYTQTAANDLNGNIRLDLGLSFGF